MNGFALTFLNPLVLAALATLPMIWLLLRVTPPSPRRIAFPPLVIFNTLANRQNVSARTPWWLLLLRMIIAASLILACAGPVWNSQPVLSGNGPILLMVDNGFPAARTWHKRAQAMENMAQEAFSNNRLVAVVALAASASPIEIKTPEQTLIALRAVTPLPHFGNRSEHLEAIEAFLSEHPDASIQWLSDGIAGAGDHYFSTQLAALTKRHHVTITQENLPDTLALAPSETKSFPLRFRVLRTALSTKNQGLVRAFDSNANILAETTFTFPPEAFQTDAAFDIPAPLSNKMSRLEIVGEKSAGAVLLLDENNRRRRVGIASATGLNQAPTLHTPSYYLERALNPYADVELVSNATAQSIGSLIDQKVDVIILANIDRIDEALAPKLSAFIEAGGLLIRFAGNRLSSEEDTLLPVPLRRGDRNLGSALSWSQPQKLAPFSLDSPFAGLTATDEITINRQILAQPSLDLNDRIWATLEDGTPLVTAEKRGQGMIVLFHVAATPSWSNLPLSGLFVDMLRHILKFGQAGSAQREQLTMRNLSPRLVLDGYGDFAAPSPSIAPIPADFVGRATAAIPAGFFGTSTEGLAVNVLTEKDTLSALDLSPLTATIRSFTLNGPVDLRMPLFLSALLLFFFDSIVMVWLAGGLSFKQRRVQKNAALLLFAMAASFFLWQGNAQAQTTSPSVEPSALQTRLGYIVTGDAEIDMTSRAGLEGLGKFLAFNTAFEPASPIALNPESDELAFYPLIYWPLSPQHPLPSERSLQKLTAYMQQGGTILFDTRDAFRNRTGMPETPETAYLRQILKLLDAPLLEPVPAHHVLTRTFFLLENFPGRYDLSALWTKSVTAQSEEEESDLNAGDNVSPILVTGNDFAAAWAIGSRGETLYPVAGSDPRQREMAFRAGANIVLYTLTGNYKSDQVHVEDVLKRLDHREGR